MSLCHFLPTEPISQSIAEILRTKSVRKTWHHVTHSTHLHYTHWLIHTLSINICTVTVLHSLRQLEKGFCGLYCPAADTHHLAWICHLISHWLSSSPHYLFTYTDSGLMKFNSANMIGSNFENWSTIGAIYQVNINICSDSRPQIRL